MCLCLWIHPHHLGTWFTTVQIWDYLTLLPLILCKKRHCLKVINQIKQMQPKYYYCFFNLDYLISWALFFSFLLFFHITVLLQVKCMQQICQRGPKELLFLLSCFLFDAGLLSRAPCKTISYKYAMDLCQCLESSLPLPWEGDPREGNGIVGFLCFTFIFFWKENEKCVSMVSAIWNWSGKVTMV